MATKKTDHSKYRGPRALWTYFTEASQDTGRSYCKAVRDYAKGGAKIGGFLPTIFGFAVAVEIPLENFGTVNYGEAVKMADEDFEQTIQHIGIDTLFVDFVLTRSEAGDAAFDNNPDNDIWRLYEITTNSQGYDVLKLIEDPEEIALSIDFASELLISDLSDIEEGVHIDDERYYTYSRITERFEESDAIYRIGGFSESRDIYLDRGENIAEEYLALQQFVSEGQAAWENGQWASVNTHFETPYRTDNPYFGSAEMFAVWGYALAAVLGFTAASGALGAAGGATTEKLKRINANRRKRKQNPQI